MLRRKMLRDMKKTPMQFISIFLMAFLTLWVYAGITSEWYGIEQYLAQYNAQTNLADMWVYGEGFSEGNVRAVSRLEGITQVQRRLRLGAEGTGDTKPALTIFFLADNIINKPYLLDGLPFDLSRGNLQSIWLDARFADATGLHAGDTYTFTLSGITMKMKIAGLVYSSENVYNKSNADLFPDYSKAGFGFCSVSSFPVREYLIHNVKNGNIDVYQMLDKLGGDQRTSARYTREQLVETAIGQLRQKADLTDMIPWNELLLKSIRLDPMALENMLNEVLRNKVTFLLNRDSVAGVADLPSKLDMLKAIGNVFPLAFFIIAVLIIITTMSRMVSNQRTQIGTLKALGFKKRKIMFHYLNYGFVLSAAGSLLGVLVGVNTLPNVFYAPLQRNYSLPVWRARVPPTIWVAILFFVMVCTLATYLSVRSILSDCAAEALRPKVQIKVKHSLWERSRVWKRLPFGVQWNLRDLSRSKVRSLMAVIGVTGSMMLLTCAFAIQDILADTRVWLYSEIQGYQTQLNLDTGTPLSRAASISNRVNGELFRVGRVDIQAGDIREAASLTVLESNELYHLTDSKRQRIDLKEGDVALSRKLAASLGVKIGERIRWRIQGTKEWAESTVDVLCQNPMSQGMIMLQSTLRKTGNSLSPISIITNHLHTENADRFVVSTFSKADMQDAWIVSMSTLIIMTAILIAAAVLLSLSVLYNLGLLSYTEMERNLATLKVIGFKTSQIRRLLFMQNIWLSLVGILDGYPSGKLLLRFIVDAMGSQRDLMPRVGATSIFLCALITLCVSAFINLMFSRKVKDIDMVISLKGME